MMRPLAKWLTWKFWSSYCTIDCACKAGSLFSVHCALCLKKNCANVFFARTLANFYRLWKIAKRTSFSEVCLFSTSRNLCQRTTVLNADVPNCYITQLYNDLIGTQYGLFSRIISLCNSSVQLSEFILKVCPAYTDKSACCYWLIAASTIDWSNCAHSSIRRVLSSSTSAILQR